MLKYFLKISFTLLLLFFLKQSVFGEVRLIAPYNGEYLEDRIVHFKWENTDDEREYLYRFVQYVEETPFGTSLSVPAKNGEITYGLVNKKIYFWKILYHPLESFNGYYDFQSELFVLGLNKEIPQSAWELLEQYNQERLNHNMQNEEEEEEEEIEEPCKEKSEEVKEENREEKKNVSDLSSLEGKKLDSKTNRKVKKVTFLSKISGGEIFQENEFNWNLSSKDVLGISQKVKREKTLCRFKYFRKRDSFETMYCNIPTLEIEQSWKYPFSDLWSVFLKGKIQRDFYIQVDSYDCEFNLFNPKTWFKCKEKLIESETILVKPHILFRVYQDINHVPIRSFLLEGDGFNLLAGYVKKYSDMRLVHTYRIINRKYNLFWDENLEYALELVNYDTSEKGGKKPLSFPFERAIGVTQWYGYTAYQSPHTGIDFGATREKILAVADGEVVGKGWDSYFGDCFSGGKYLKIKQDSGIYTVYFHLEDIYVNCGDFVKEGEIVARSGNSGAWNCQPLAHHLHLETRENASSSSHRNPTQHINVDWNKIPTLGWEKYPGRLTGENPHPGW